MTEKTILKNETKKPCFVHVVYEINGMDVYRAFYNVESVTEGKDFISIDFYDKGDPLETMIAKKRIVWLKILDIDRPKQSDVEYKQQDGIEF